ncbi:MAG: hypothetical protein AAGK47_10465 [Bacteroidota bacterium]
MQDIEPFYHWRDRYVAAEDSRSPFYGRTYNEFYYTQKIYNYFIHPQWDNFGSPTLYMKVLFADYEEGFAIFEFIGEWNDCVTNDIMFLKRDVIDPMLEEGISKFLIICENVLNFHGDEDDYYEELYEDVKERDGWVILLNTLNHVAEEMRDTRLQNYVYVGDEFNDLNWRPQKPKVLVKALDALVNGEVQRFLY